MNETLFRQLLYQSEGTDLDLKGEQYAFRGADDRSKSKLLKDILVFANSWRQGDAYILIGVVELENGRRDPCGIDPGTHLEDASLQQFVNSKTNRSAIFSYEAFHLDGATFGVIVIPKQERPTYVLKNFGIVKAQEVYYRRGSSCAVASPEEVHRMGFDDGRSDHVEPLIRLQLADTDNRRLIGAALSLQAICHSIHNREAFPDAVKKRSPVDLFSVMGPDNKHYWRDLADHIFHKRAFHAVGLAASNISGSLAKNVRIEIECLNNVGVRFVEGPRLPKYPTFEGGLQLRSIAYLNSSLVKRIVPVIAYHDDRVTFSISFGDIQPKATAWTEHSAFMSAWASGTYVLSARIFADNISQPQECKIQLTFEIESRPALTFEEIKEMDKHRGDFPPTA